MLEHWLAPFFADPIEIEEEFEDMSEEKKKNLEEAKNEALGKLQAEAIDKQKHRNDVMGELLRSKGFLWLATSNDLIGAWQQAGNVLRIRGESEWMCLTPEFWVGTPSEPLVRQVMITKAVFLC